MSDAWFILIQGETIGPIPSHVVGALLRCARFLPSDFLWEAGMPAWERAGDLSLFSAPLPAAATPMVPMPPLPVKREVGPMAEAVEIEETSSQSPGAPHRFWVLRMVRVRVTGTADIDDFGTFPVYDLSESGVFLVTTTPLAVGTHIRMNLISTEFARPLQLEGTVARIGRSEGGQNGFAIRFEGIAAAERLLIQELVKTKHVKRGLSRG